MKDELLRCVYQALDRLIVDEIQSSNEPRRYHSVRRLANIAAEINTVAGTRAAEFVCMDDDVNEAGAANIDMALRPRIRPAPIAALGMNAPDWMRELLATLQHQVTLQNTPRPERVLDEMLSVREKLVQQKLPLLPEFEARIAALTREVTTAALAPAGEVSCEDPPPPEIEAEAQTADTEGR